MLGSHQLLRAALQQDHPYVVGLDVSLTSTGVYLLSLNPDDDHPDFHYHITTKPKDNSDASRIDFIVDTVVTDLTNPQYPVIAACMEDYGPSGRIAGKVLVRAELCGVLKHLLRYRVKIPYVTISPNGLKKVATGSGRSQKGQSSKDAMLRAANEAGFITKNSDEADAYHAAQFCAAFVRGEKLAADYRRVNPMGYTFSENPFQSA